MTRSRRYAASQVVWAATLAALVGACVAFLPDLAAAAIGVAAFPLLLRSALFRSGFLVVGGLVTLHSGVDSLTADKVVYALGVGLAVAVAGTHVLRRRLVRQREREAVDSLWALMFAFGVLCLVSLPVSLVFETSISDWLRDASSYALIAIVPLFVADLAGEVTDWRVIGALFAPLAFASTVSFFLEWLHRRQVLDFDASFGLPSFLFPASLFACAVSAALLARNSRVRLRATVVSAAVFGFLIATGTRTTVILLTGFLPPLARLVARPAQNRWQRLVLAAAAVAVLGGLVGAVATLSTGRISDRLRTIPDAIANPTADPSYQLRANAWRVAWDEFQLHPVAGVGPGFRFTLRPLRTGGPERVRYNVDSPLGFLAKFGVVGLAVLALSLLSVGRFMAATRTAAAEVPWWATIGFACIVLCFVPFGVPLEDKGIGFGLLGLLAMVAVSAQPRTCSALVSTPTTSASDAKNIE